MDEFEQIIMSIISHAGQAKSLCYQALEQSRKGLHDQANESIRQAEECLGEIHHVHGSLLGNENLPSDPRSLLLLMHAEDIYMSTMSEKELAKHLVIVGSSH